MVSEVVCAELMAKAIDKLLLWSFAKDHPLQKCTAEVKRLIQSASELAKERRFDEAINELALAASKDRKYVGSRVRLMKYLINYKEQPMTALLIGGSALALTRDNTARSLVLDLASGVALNAYKRSEHLPYLEESLDLSSKSTILSPDDIVFSWNRLEILILLAEAERKRGNAEASTRYTERSQAAVAVLIQRARSGGDTTILYWRRIVADAREVFPTSAWWQDRLHEMECVCAQLEVDSSADLSARTLEHRDWKKIAFVAALLGALALSAYFIETGAPTPDKDKKDTDAVEELGQVRPFDDSDIAGQLVKYFAWDDTDTEPTPPDSGAKVPDYVERSSSTIARVDHDDLALARVDHDDLVLARVDHDDAMTHLQSDVSELDFNRIRLLIAKAVFTRDDADYV